MNDISKLFARDPLNLTRTDIAPVVEQDRAARRTNLTKEMPKKARAKKRKADPAQIDLEELLSKT